MSAVRLPGWRLGPRVGLVIPAEGEPGWSDAAFWAAKLDAWGTPWERLRPTDVTADPARTTLVVPALAIDGSLAARLDAASGSGVSLLVTGSPGSDAARLLGLGAGHGASADRLVLDHGETLERARACLPGPDACAAVVLERAVESFDLPGSWTVTARDGSGAGLVAHRPVVTAPRPTAVAWFGIPADSIDWRSTEVVALLAERTLEAAAPLGLVGLARWPDARRAALVVDGDVDHPTGVDPECSRYVAPALATARLAGFEAYGIFVAAANVDAEPASFPPAPGYYNHSYGHPYSYWDPRPWESLTAGEMAEELRRANGTYRRHLECDDEGLFRLPHFQLEAADRTYGVLEALGYRAESSIGANVSITAGLPYHPARVPWSDRPPDVAWARTHPDPERRYPFLQLPLSTDPSAPDFLDGCCSYNTLAEGVRRRTVEPDAYERLLDDVVARAVARHGLAHVFIDPPDAGYGRLPGDRPDYATAIERWLRRCVGRDDLAILTTAGLATWWAAREHALTRLAWSIDRDDLVVTLADGGPPGIAFDVLPPRRGDAVPPRRQGPMERSAPVGMPGGKGDAT